MLGAAKFGERLLSRHRAAGLLVVLLIGLAVPKLALSAATHAPGIDGGYYADIAANVRDGRGLQTDVSLLHKGYPAFPHPTDIYPLWPLLYGLTARVFPLVPAGVWLSTALYFASLVIAHRWATRVWPEPFFERFPLDAGHVTVIVLGLASSYFEMTSLPYTEGLAFTLLLAALWRAHAILPRMDVRSGAELGAWAGVLVLARTQLLLVFLALVGTWLLALTFQPGRARTTRSGLAMLVAFAVVLAPQWLHLRSFMPDATPLHLLRFEKTQATSVLTPFEVIKPGGGLVGFVLDRARGFVVAFAPTRAGYWSQLNVFTYAPLLAAPPFVVGLVRRARGGGIAGARGWMARPEHLPVLFLAIFVVGAFLSIHTMHKLPDAWYFHRRHALPSIFLVVASLVFLLRGGRALRAAGLLTLVVGLALGARQAARSVSTASSRAYAPSPALLRWIEDEKARHPRPILALRRPQTVAWRTEGVGYHWFDASTSARDLVAMVEQLGATAVLLPARSPVERDPLFRRHFEAGEKVAGARVHRPRTTPVRDVEPPPPAPADEGDEPGGGDDP